MDNSIIWTDYEDGQTGYAEKSPNIRFSTVRHWDFLKNSNVYLIYSWDDQDSDEKYLLYEHPGPSGYITVKAAQNECAEFLKVYLGSAI